ncbi:MAG: hypothetical protein MJ048_00580 [Acidaminococcaceae bacterium]|nr:hypothetical protein [Acidaminococcaceae bacterium]
MGKKNKNYKDWKQQDSRTVLCEQSTKANVEGLQEEFGNSPYFRKEFVLPKQYLIDLLKNNAVSNVEVFVEKISALREAVQPLIEGRFIKMKNKRVWFDRDVAGLYPQFDKVELPYVHTYYRYICNFRKEDVDGLEKDEDGAFSELVVDGIDFVLLTDEEGYKTFWRGNGNIYMDPNGEINGIDNGSLFKGYYVTCNYRPANGNNCLWFSSTTNRDKQVYDRSGYYVALIPICRLNGKNGKVMSTEQTLLKWFELKLIPDGLDENTEKVFVEIMQSYQKSSDADFWKSEYWLEENEVRELLLHFVKKQEGEAPTLIGYDLNWKKVLDRIDKEKIADDFVWDVIEKNLLECDYKRVNLVSYDKSQVNDLQKGHWELDVRERSEESKNIILNVPQNRKFVARPPQMDVDEACVCAIDFGTKSTVVVEYKNNESRLIRVGKGDFSKAPNDKDYENPTFMQFRSISNFLKKYTMRKGRPFTEYNDLVVSHQAVDNSNAEGIGSDICYSFFGELKQWANDRNRKLYLQDLQNEIRELKPYLQLSADDIDPIELYAYYLGSYINNMHKGICLRYILSFPVNYEKTIQEKIRQSIENGLKKSLPLQILNDATCMEIFEVDGHTSEPVAYAASALRAFGLEPAPDSKDKVFYGVFDFGGGTTDFDFGFIQRYENKKKYRFKIEQFGKGGDAYLGGENLLNLIAYKVYCDNLDFMRKNHITIVLPHDGQKMAGTETLVLESGNATEKARMNLKILSEKLRCIWEDAGTDEFKSVNVTLFSEQGDVRINAKMNKKTKESKKGGGGTKNSDDVYENKQNENADNKNDDDESINVDVTKLKELIKSRIERTVKDFFIRLEEAFKNEFSDNNQKAEIHIFLAGNSCKSPFVKELFDKYVKEECGKNKSGKNFEEVFKVHPPLGSGQNENLEQDDYNDQKVTGKTGVAFGLIRFRKGGKDVTIVNKNEDEHGEIKFPYYLGEEGEGGMFSVQIGEGIGYGEWAWFCYADQMQFDIYYTKSASAQTGKLQINEIASPLVCRISREEVNKNEDYGIYVCKKSPDTIEYAVGTKDDFENPDKVKQMRNSGKIHIKKISVGG